LGEWPLGAGAMVVSDSLSTVLVTHGMAILFLF
jgi:hypothetical protein